METLSKILGVKLQELRIENKVKQVVMAKEFNRSQQSYSKLERGEVQFTNNIVSKICDFFNITIHAFLNTGNNIKIIDSQQANTTNSFNNDSNLIQDLLKSKDELIKSQQQIINMLQEHIAK